MEYSTAFDCPWRRVKQSALCRSTSSVLAFLKVLPAGMQTPSTSGRSRGWSFTVRDKCTIRTLVLYSRTTRRVIFSLAWGSSFRSREAHKIQKWIRLSERWLRWCYRCAFSLALRARKPSTNCNAVLNSRLTTRASWCAGGGLDQRWLSHNSSARCD